MPDDPRLEPLERLFEESGWAPFPFQREVWKRYLAGESGLVHSATGTGKTLAAYLGAVAEGLGESAPGLKVLWVTPLRALALDTARSLEGPLQALGSTWRVDLRTGDTDSARKTKQRKDQPDVLVTTPESLSLMLTHEPDEWFGALRLVVVDEWHELLASKRGVQTELALARLRTFRPDLRTWGLSATLGNLPEALRILMGEDRAGMLVKGEAGKEIAIESILPTSTDRFPWSGHYGTQMVGPVVRELGKGGTSLVFCNTRAQAELWFQAILTAKPSWKETIGLHHGSLDRAERDASELGLKNGTLRAVVCTSSLDLGVDFAPVDRVIQIGSPKGVARLLQRAGRSGHRPGLPSRVLCVPTHGLELIDIASAREAAQEGRIESREGLDRPLDVLVQHLVTCALGGGFTSNEMLAEVRSTFAYRDLSSAEWEWCLDFVARGGSSLHGYPEYHRVAIVEGRYAVQDKDIAMRHRMSIGTITADSAMSVQFVGGGRLGSVEESFLARLKPGDKFLFSGKILEFVRVKDMTAWVRRATGLKGAIPKWGGSRLPLSTQLASSIRQRLEEAKYGVFDSPEMLAIARTLAIQSRWSAIPAGDEFLIERYRDREGHHLFFYPVEGRLVHEGLSALLALRISRLTPITFSIAANDYGFELLSADAAPLEEALSIGLLSPEGLIEDIAASLNEAELARRQFREIARVAGLTFGGFPGRNKSARQLQASSGLFYDVFARFDPENPLLVQAHREVLERQLEKSRLTAALERLQNARMLLVDTERPTPLAFPILVDRLRETVTSESLADRVARMTLGLEEYADAEEVPA